MSRRTCSYLPTADELLDPEVITCVPQKIEKRGRKAKFYYDRTAKELPELIIMYLGTTSNHLIVTECGKLKHVHLVHTWLILKEPSEHTEESGYFEVPAEACCKKEEKGRKRETLYRKEFGGRRKSQGR